MSWVGLYVFEIISFRSHIAQGETSHRRSKRQKVKKYEGVQLFQIFMRRKGGLLIFQTHRYRIIGQVVDCH